MLNALYKFLWRSPFHLILTAALLSSAYNYLFFLNFPNSKENARYKKIAINNLKIETGTNRHVGAWNVEAGVFALARGCKITEVAVTGTYFTNPENMDMEDKEYCLNRL